MKQITIPEVFRGQDIFVTGGTGFLGKALIEKLLRSCSNLNRIFVLIRSKKGKTAEERLREILDTELFAKVRAKSAALLKKVVAIEGDSTLIRLGISDADLELMKDVSIVFNSAASVKFDDPLKEAIILNTRGARETFRLAETFSKLKVFVHISTTYSNPDYNVVEEKLYPPIVDWRTAIKLAETYSTETLNIFNLKYSGYQPNTYTFSKSLAEQIANEYKDKFPVLVFRPSIVISTVEEPVPGWIDNFNGPVGLFLASGFGIVRVCCADPNLCLDYMPVDVCIKGLLVTTYKHILEGSKPEELPVYNCSSATVRPIGTGDIIELAKKIIVDDPMEQTFWPPGGGVTKSKIVFYFKFMTLHIFFAFLADIAIRISGRKPFFMKLQRKIFVANKALYRFNVTHWVFQNQKFYDLDNCVMPSDHKNFAFKHYTELNLEEYFRNALIGAKYFLLNMPKRPTKSARLRYQIMLAVKFFLTMIIYLLVARTVIRYLYRNYYQTL